VGLVLDVIHTSCCANGRRCGVVCGVQVLVDRNYVPQEAGTRLELLAARVKVGCVTMLPEWQKASRFGAIIRVECATRHCDLAATLLLWHVL
jgi:hypothetical protein